MAAIHFKEESNPRLTEVSRPGKKFKHASCLPPGRDKQHMRAHLLFNFCTIAFSSVIQAGLGQMVLLLIGLDAMVVVLAIILFPFLWKD